MTESEVAGPLSQGAESVEVFKQGAEAKLYISEFYGRPCIIKERFSKKYRHPILDQSLTKERMKAEAKSLLRCRTIGVLTPAVYFVDLVRNRIHLEYLTDAMTVKQFIVDEVKGQPVAHESPLLTVVAQRIGNDLFKMHSNNIIHGDLTTSNMLVRTREHGQELDLYLIDFGLSYFEPSAEDKAVDLYVLEKAFLSTHPNTELLFELILSSYEGSYGGGDKVGDVMRKLDEVRLRGRKRSMVG